MKLDDKQCVKLYHGMTEIDEQLIEEALKYIPDKQSGLWLRIVAAAACLVLFGGLLTIFIKGGRSDSAGLFADSTDKENTTIAFGTDGSWTEDVDGSSMTDSAMTQDTATDSNWITTEAVADIEGLPKIPAGFDTGAMGFEGLMFYDISESSSKNPWSLRGSEEELKYLPVFRNLAYTDSAGMPLYLSREEMLTAAEQAAEVLGYDITETQYHSISDVTDMPSDDTEDCYSLIARFDGGTITVAGNGMVTIILEKTSDGAMRSDPEDIWNMPDIPYVNEEYLQSYTDQYRTLTGLDQEIYEVWGDYTFSGERSMWYSAYNPSDDLETAILNYNFDRTEFLTNDSQGLYGLRYGDLLDAAELLGDYPIRTEADARQSLLAGNYLTTVPSEYLTKDGVTEDIICKVELVYQTGNINEYYAPYYKYYVRLDRFHEIVQNDEIPDGLDCYGIYYVPAVREEYLEMSFFMPASASMNGNDLYTATDKAQTFYEVELFSEKYYRVKVNHHNHDIISIERTAQINDIPDDQLYSGEDIDGIMRELLGTSGEIRETKAGDYVSGYDEYQNGFQTGKAASVTYESGYMKYIVLRNGKLNGANDESDFIDKRAAYVAGISEIQKKYRDKNIILKDDYDETNITVYYNPPKECLCYTFEIEGAVDGNWDDELSIFVFTPIINVNDISDIEVASTFGY